MKYRYFFSSHCNITTAHLGLHPSSHHRLYFNTCRRQHQHTRTCTRVGFGAQIFQGEVREVHQAFAVRPDHLLRRKCTRTLSWCQAPAVAPSPSFWRAYWWSMTTQRRLRTAPARRNRLEARGQRRRRCRSRRRHRRGRRGRRRRGNRAISCPRSPPLPGKPAARPGKGARASGGKSWAGCHWQLN